MKKHYTLIAALMFVCLAAMGREGVYVEYKISGGAMSGNNKTYSSDGDVRSEMTMQSSRMPNAITAASLSLHSTPGKSYMINEKDKTYSETELNKTAETHREEDDYEVTLIGKETVNGFSSTHVRIKNKRTQHESEMWMSKDVKGYANFANIKTKYFGGSKFFNQLKEKGAEGFVVRMVSMSEHGNTSMQMDLVKVENRDMPESLFSLSGYTKTATYQSPLMQQQAMPGGKTMEEVQKMTPEERKAYIDQMAKQHYAH